MLSVALWEHPSAETMLLSVAMWEHSSAKQLAGTSAKQLAGTSAKQLENQQRTYRMKRKRCMPGSRSRSCLCTIGRSRGHLWRSNQGRSSFCCTDPTHRSPLTLQISAIFPDTRKRASSVGPVSFPAGARRCRARESARLLLWSAWAEARGREHALRALECRNAPCSRLRSGSPRPQGR